MFWACKLVSTKRILPPQPLTNAVANQGTPDEAASDTESLQEVPSFPLMIPDEMSLDELARRAPASGQQDEAGLAFQGQSASVAPADVPLADAAMEDPPLRRGDVMTVVRFLLVLQRPHVLMHQSNS